MAMEPRATVAAWAAATNTLTVWLQAQSPARSRDDIARTLNLPVAAVRVITPDVGGTFGARASVHPEDLLVALAARRFAATVKWTGTRSEEFVSAAPLANRSPSLKRSCITPPARRGVGLRLRDRADEHRRRHRPAED